MPISRNHGGLVHLLHVGRTRAKATSYYVMELADDRHTGRTWIRPGLPAETLSGELRERGALPWPSACRSSSPWPLPLDTSIENGWSIATSNRPTSSSVKGAPKFADVGW